MLWRESMAFRQGAGGVGGVLVGMLCKWRAEDL